MRLRARKSSLAASVLLALLLPAFARAAASSRVFLGLNGNDSNDCANPATPCFSFAGALAQVATGGEVIVEDTGGYGPLNITKSVSINSAPGVVAFCGAGVTVNAPGGVVVLRGLTIDGNGAMVDAISVAAISALHIESCVVANFTESPGGLGSGIAFLAPGYLFVKDTIVRHTRVGVWVMPGSGSAYASLDHCRLEGNDTGFITNPGGSASVVNSIASGNAHSGFQNQGGELNVEKCVTTNNQSGLWSFSGTMRASNTTITDNSGGVSVVGGSVLSRGNNTLQGNGINGAFTGTFSAK